MTRTLITLNLLDLLLHIGDGFTIGSFSRHFLGDLALDIGDGFTIGCFGRHFLRDLALDNSTVNLREMLIYCDATSDLNEHSHGLYKPV